MEANGLLGSFLKSQKTLALLDSMRKGSELATLELSGLTPDDRTYLEAEDCVRSVLYSQLESRIQPGTSPWVRKLAYCYRDLFINPERALNILDELDLEVPTHFELPLRLKFWRAHLNLILGRIEVGKRSLTSIASKIPECMWKSEMLAIRALGYYFIGRTHDALKAHHDCQNSLNDNPDIFLQTFDCGMAARTALKLCAPTSFEYFSERLDEALRKKDDSRYRLRHTGYRAMIFNQLGEHETAEVHWKIGDEQLHQTESALERGQYLVFRGMSYALIHDLAKARRQFDLARHELKIAGSPAVYLAELDIAEHLSEIASPQQRGLNLKAATIAAENAHKHFSALAGTQVYPLQAMYSETAEFCDGILNGSALDKSFDGRQSLVLSVIENVSTAQQFAKQLSHFRLIPDFIHKLSESDLTYDGLLDAMQTVLRIRPILNDSEFHLPGAMHLIERQYEVKTILDFASTLYLMGTRLNELNAARSRLKEAERARHLLHDIRPYIQELSQKSKKGVKQIDLAKLSDDLNALIESHLKAMLSGENPALPTIVNFPELLNQVTDTVEQSTGKRPVLVTKGVLPFLWISDELLKRLLINLIKNGIEAGSGKAPVSVSYKIESFEGVEKLIVFVSDNGGGLNADYFEKIKANSDSIDVSTKKGGIGLGLGSAIERSKDLGIDLELIPSMKSTGTTFKLTIPLASNPFLSISPEILVIDDSPKILEAWRTFGVTEQIPVKAVTPEESVGILNHLSERTLWIAVDYHLGLSRTTGADLGNALLKLGKQVALSTGYHESELPVDALAVNWSAIIGKDPQYPTEEKRMSQAPSQPAQTSMTDDLDHSMRHEIRNELTPLKTALKGLKSNHPDDPYVTLLSNSVKGIEKLTIRKSEKNAAG